MPRYSGNGTQQMGIQVEGVSHFDSGEWTVTIRDRSSIYPNGVSSIVAYKWEVEVEEVPRLDTDMDVTIEIYVSNLPIDTTIVSGGRQL